MEDGSSRPDSLCCGPSAVCCPGRQPAQRVRAAPAFTQVNSLPDVHSWEDDSQPQWKFLSFLSGKMPLVRIDAAPLTGKAWNLSQLGSGTQIKQVVLMGGGLCPLEFRCSVWSLVVFAQIACPGSVSKIRPRAHCLGCKAEFW